MKSILSAALLTLSLIAFPLAATAQGQGHVKISPALNTSSEDKVEVMEFFWLGCPHCYALEPDITAWEKNKPEYIEFVREAPPLNPAWEQHSRGFYAAQLLGIEQEFVEKMFEAIHVKKKRMRKPKDIAALASELGVDKAEFLDVMKDFSVGLKMQRASQLAASAGITGVPAIVVNGKYLTSSNHAGGNPAMIKEIDFLAEKENTDAGS